MLSITKTFTALLFSLILLHISCKQKSKNNLTADERELELKKNIDSIIRIERNNTEYALTLYKKGLEDCKTEEYDEGVNRYYKFIVFNLCIYQNKFSDANKIATEHLEFAKSSNSNVIISDAYGNIALTYITRDITDSAAYNYLNAIDYAKKENDSTRLNGIYRNIVKVYLLQKQYQRGLQYALINLAYAKAKKDTASIASNYNNISIIYKELNDTAQWKQCINNAYAFLNNINDPSLKLAILNSKASYYMENKVMDSALRFVELAETWSKKIKDTFHISQAQYNKAYCKLKVQNVSNAIKDLKNADLLSKKIEVPLEKAKEFENIRYQIFNASGNLKMALEARDKYISLSDSLYKINSSKIYSETEAKIAAANFNKSLSEKKLMITKRNNIIAVLSIGILSLGIIGFLFYRNQLKKKLLQENNIKLLKKENQWAASKAALEAQLEERNRISREIHDELGASLTSIALSTDLLKSKMKDHSEEVYKISNTSSDMVDALNEIIWSLNSRNDSVKSLIAYTRKMFINLLEDTNIKHHFTVNEIEEDCNISGTARRAIFLTTREALNNALKHSKATAINILFSLKNNNIDIQITDNGIGINNTNEFGNGMTNMKTNIEKIGGILSVINNNGTTIKINWTLKNNENG